MSQTPIPTLPQSWSALTWQQLTDCWTVKLQYSGNRDAARAAALLALLKTDCHTPSATNGQDGGKESTGCGTGYCIRLGGINPNTGEQQYLYTTSNTAENREGALLFFTPRQLAYLAKQALTWFDYPYGDQGEEPIKDEKGLIVKEGRVPVNGYVNPDWRDAMALPKETIEIDTVTFSLPQLACNNLTWEQYRSLQTLAPQLFQDEATDVQVLQVQAEFMAHCMIPEVPQNTPDDRFRPRHTFKYNAERATQTVDFWIQHLQRMPYLFHVCFQTYQTAVQYYAKVYPLLFSEKGKNDPLRDALTGEVGTINTIMKYAGYAEQQQVYDSNIPFVLDILNNMTKDAREIEKMNARIKRK